MHTIPDKTPKKMESTEVHWQHNWLFVIIPVQDAHVIRNYDDSTDIPDTFPLLSAYCKACDNYFTKRLQYDVGLPKYGCVGPIGSI
jgi:hypothetical protein